MAVVISERLLDSCDRLLDAEPDAQLVVMVQAGHEVAFAAIVRRYERELQAQARRLTFDGRGEDAVQQAFLNAFAALRSGRDVRHLRGWLHQILRNEITRARLPVDAPLDAVTAYGETLEDTVQRRAAAHATLAELSALPDRQRDALLGTAVLGFPREQVARTMGLSEGAVRQLVHRARLRLRQAATALIPFPLVRLFGTARSGVDAAPDATLGAGTAAGGGLVIKVGALVASGVVATGIAVTHAFPLHHHTAALAHGSRYHVTHTRAPARGSLAPAVAAGHGDPASVTIVTPLSALGLAGASADGRVHGGPGRLSQTGSGRHAASGSGRGGARGGGQDGSSSGRRDDGAGGLRGGTSSGPGRDGDGSGSPSGTGGATGSRLGSGSGPGDGAASDGERTGAGSGSGPGSGSGSPIGATVSGSDDGTATSGGGHGSSGPSGGDGGSVTPIGGGAGTSATSGSSDSSSGASATPATATGGTTSGGAGGGSSDASVSGGSSDGGTTGGGPSSTGT